MMGNDQTPSVLSNLPSVAGAGFADLAPMTSAWAWLDALPMPGVAETVPLQAASGRVLAEDVSLDPATSASLRVAINGYAVRAAACVGASNYNPLLLALLPPGTNALPEAASCPLACGWALPSGADAVLPLDAAQPNGAEWLEVLDAVPRGSGIESPPPTLHLSAGRALRPQDLGCLEAAGASSVTVLGRPRVALLVPGAKSGPDMLTPMLQALLWRDGARGVAIALAAAEPSALAAALAGPIVNTCDVVLLAGRAGAGIDDVAPAQVKAAGGSIALRGLALRPGGSSGLASLPGKGGTLPLLLLPGDPFGCLAAYDLLAARVVRRFAGITPALPYSAVDVPLARKIVSGLGSMDLVAVRLVGGKAEQVPTDFGLTGAASADGFVLVAEGSEGYPAGARVPVHLYGSTMQGGLP